MVAVCLLALQVHPAAIATVVQMCDARLLSGGSLVSPIIFIGESVLLDQAEQRQFPRLDQKILGLMNNKSVDFHFRLSKHLKRLICLMDDPGKTVESVMAGIGALKDKAEVHAMCLYCAGVLKGLKIKHLMSVMVFDNIGRVLAASKKKDFKDLELGKRYYCVFMISALWHTFGKILEPFLESIFQVLTSLMGDIEEDVRKETNAVIKQIMQEISEYGVKFIIPVLIKGSNDKNWRTQLNSLYSLGFVAHFRTKQLSTSLPLIVPQLTSMINDTNTDIKEAAVSSLSLIVSTIRNPEIIENRDVIIKSLSDPFNYNNKSLDFLLQTQFQHFIDGPALSLIMPIITYGLRFSHDIPSKINAAKVVASISLLINNDNDILTNIDVLLDGLVSSIKDVDPDVRAYSAKAFKSIALKFPNLSKMMLNTLKEVLENEHYSSVERVS